MRKVSPETVKAIYEMLTHADAPMATAAIAEVSERHITSVRSALTVLRNQQAVEPINKPIHGRSYFHWKISGPFVMEEQKDITEKHYMPMAEIPIVQWGLRP